MRRNARERQRQRGGTQAIEMLGEPENLAAIEPQTFPNGVAALHDRIEWADAALIAMHQFAIDVDDQVAILLVKDLQH